MNWKGIFYVAVRCVLLFAYIAFLSASISHVATFFNNFEADKTAWIQSYMLAISIDLTGVILTIGMMFFRRNMPMVSQVIIWVFIGFLTAFSWVVNWEYATTYQGTELVAHGFLVMLNPVLASAFAFLNLAYTIIAEFYTAKVQTAQELNALADELEATEVAQQRLNAYRMRNKKASVIQRAKDAALEAKQAYNEVVQSGENHNDMHQLPVVNTPPDASETGTINPEIKTVQVPGETAALTPCKEEVIASEDVAQEPGETVAKDTPQARSAPARSVTIKEASVKLGFTESYIRELRNKGKLRSTGRNKNMITLSSIEAFLKSRQSKEENALVEMPKESKNGHQNGHNTDEIKAIEMPRLEV